MHLLDSLEILEKRGVIKQIKNETEALVDVLSNFEDLGSEGLAILGEGISKEDLAAVKTLNDQEMQQKIE